MHTRQLLAMRSRVTSLTQMSRIGLPATSLGMKFSSKDNFMNGSNANYIDYMYSQWQKDPSSVHASWNAYFAGEEGGASSSFTAPPTLGRSAVDSQL